MERPGIRRCIFVIQVCILTIISSMFINFNISLEQTPMITLTNTQSIFNTYEIRVKSVIVDEKIFKPSDIFYGDYTIDGETILLNNGSTIEGQLPEGKSHKIVFETGTYRGNCIITVDGRSYEISTYSGYWDSVEHNLLQKHEITVKKVLQILIFATIIAFYYYISARYFGYMRENLITKCLMVISGTVATLIMASNTSVGLIMGISVVLSIPVHIILSENINKWVKNSKNLINYFSAFLTICLMITLIRGSYSYFSSLISVRNEYFNIIVSIIYLISLPFFYIAVNTLTNYIISKGMCSLKNTDTFERRFLISSLIIYIGIIVIVYFNSSAFTDGFYLNSLGQVSQRSADIIYGYDHSWIQAAVSELTIHNYDIRHPLLKWILIVPASAFQVVFSIFTPISKQFYGGALAIMSTVFMVFTAILLKRMTKCNWIAPTYT